MTQDLRRVRLLDMEEFREVVKTYRNPDSHHPQTNSVYTSVQVVGFTESTVHLLVTYAFHYLLTGIIYEKGKQFAFAHSDFKGIKTGVQVNPSGDTFGFYDIEDPSKQGRFESAAAEIKQHIIDYLDVEGAKVVLTTGGI